MEPTLATTNANAASPATPLSRQARRLWKASIPRLVGPLLLTLLLPLQASAGPLEAAACRELRDRRNRIAAEAMQAEIALVMDIRRRMCPRLETLAERANASEIPVSLPAPGTAQAPASMDDLDYGAYVGCRRQAEERLRRSRVVLTTNRLGFPFYTLRGARLAREADALQQQLMASCDAAFTAP